MMVNQSYYSQLRYIGVANNGREIVRVDQSGSLRWSVDEADLQEKGGELYMMDSISLNPDEVRLGEISLNREHGEIDPRRIPTMRVMTPIFDQNDQLFGVVIANVNIERLMAHTFDEARLDIPLLLSAITVKSSSTILCANKAGCILPQINPASIPSSQVLRLVL